MTTNRVIAAARRYCTYCPKAGPEVCVRMINATRDNPAGVPVFAHRACAEGNHDQILYALLPERSVAG